MAREGQLEATRRWMRRVVVVAATLVLALVSFPAKALAEDDFEAAVPAGTLEPDLAAALEEHRKNPPSTERTTPPSGIFHFFPVQGDYSYRDTFGDPRPNDRTHTGVDILAERRTPVVAVAPGVVIAAEVTDGISGTYVKIRHHDGSTSSYVHLNNDTPGTDNGLGVGIAEGIEAGVSVEAGTVIGYVGDSGNAEDTVPHLHFAYSPDGRTAMNPYPELRLVEGFAADEVLLLSLPFTGLDVDRMTVIAAVLILSGVAVLVLGIREEEQNA